MKKINIILLIICGFGLGIVSVLWFNFISNNIYSSSVYQWSLADHENNINKSVTDKIKQSLNSSNTYKKFDQIKYILETRMYIDSWLNETWMLNSALHGRVDWIGDSHTTYFDGEENKDFNKDISWSQDFEWIWAYIAKKWNTFVVQEVIKWSPAYNSWIKADDIILELSWQKVNNNLTVNQIVSIVRWPKWSIANIVIYRPSTKAIIKFGITRDKIIIHSVTSKIIEYKSKKIWYINISMIWEDTYNNFVTQLEDMKSEWIQAIILDLRWNGWWLLPVAWEIMSNRVSTWQLLAAAKYKAFVDDYYYSSWYMLADKLPTVVIIDDMTASASEIIAWWLQELAWIKLIWTKTYGKWSVQTIHEFEDWSSVKYTIWKWYLPSGKNIDWVWIKPDIEVSFDSELYRSDLVDNQLQTAQDAIYDQIK